MAKHRLAPEAGYGPGTPSSGPGSPPGGPGGPVPDGGLATGAAAPEAAAGAGAGPVLGQRARRALGWSFLNNIVGRVGSALTAIVLARILAPADYGIYAVALVALMALLSLNELGVSLAIVRWPGSVDRIAPTVATLALGTSGLLYAGAFTAAPAVCSALHAPQAVGVLRLLTASVLIDALTAVPAALMSREFMQGRRLVVDTVGFVVVTSVSISLATSGHGAWSLAWGTILGNIANGVLILWWAPRRYRPGFNREVAGELLAFGLPLAGASLLLIAMLNVDYVLVGHLLGPVALGFYLLAFNLSAWPVALFSTPVRRVSLPVFSRLQEDPARAAAAFVRAGTLLLAGTLPACLLLSAFAVPLVGFVYGSRWEPAAQALPYLAVLALVRVFSELAYDFLVAVDRSRANLTIQALWFALLVPALWIGARVDGIRGVAVGHAVVAVLAVLPAYTQALRRCGVTARALLAGCVRPFLGVLVGAGLSAAVLQLVPGRFAELAVGGTVVMLGYLAVVHPLRHLATFRDDSM